MKTVSHLVRKNIASLRGYVCARMEHEPGSGEFLDANENSIGSPGHRNLNRYPDPFQTRVKSKIAPLFGVDPSCLFLGNGSDEAIDLLIRIFCEPKQDSILITPPTYGMYEVCADTHDVKCHSVPLRKDFSLDVKGIARQVLGGTKIVFLCSPNNPTGNLLDGRDIIAIAEQNNAIVVADEAYIDFSGTEGVINYISRYANLVVLRTFSKAWGLAGIRLGIAVANPEIIALFNKVKMPYNVDTVTQELTLEAIDNRKEKERMVELLVHERNILAENLAKLSCVEFVYPSSSNFLLVKCRDKDAVLSALGKKGIFIRDRSSAQGCERCVRITVGTPEINRAIVNILQNL